MIHVDQHAINRRRVLQGLVAAALPLSALSCGEGSSGIAKGEPLVVGGLPVTCNLTLPVACAAKARSNAALAAGQPRFEYKYSKYSGWPEVKESLMAGRIPAAYMLAPLVMDLADKKMPYGHKADDCVHDISVLLK